MDINPIAAGRIDELEAELAEMQSKYDSLESYLTQVEVNLQLALAQNAAMMSDRMHLID